MSEKNWFKEESGDLFSVNYESEWSLCHCVSADLAMGAGIAVMFKRIFGRVDELRSQGKKVREIALLTTKKTDIYYLITKERYFEKPTYNSLETTLLELRNLMLTRGKTKLAMPRIGSGLDGLDWTQVKEIIIKVFENTGIRVVVWYK